jgi:hypothetical protein
MAEIRETIAGFHRLGRDDRSRKVLSGTGVMYIRNELLVLQLKWRPYRYTNEDFQGVAQRY